MNASKKSPEIYLELNNVKPEKDWTFEEQHREGREKKGGN